MSMSHLGGVDSPGSFDGSEITLSDIAPQNFCAWPYGHFCAITYSMYRG